MKKLIAILMCALPLALLAQRKDQQVEKLMSTPALAYEQHQYSIGNTAANAITANINANPDEYAKDLKSYLKASHAIEGKKNNGFLSTFKTVVPQWSTDTMNFHYKVEKDGDGARLIVAAEQKGVFITDETNLELSSKIKASLSSQIKAFYLKHYDKVIADQQKYYDGQVSDFEKLRKKQDKLNTKMQSTSKSKQKTENNIREANTGVNKKEGDIKSLNSELQNNKNAVAQAQKEVDAQTALIATKEGEYNRLNYSGALNTKEGERVIKDLGKLRKKQEKLQSNLTKASSKLTKTENGLLKAEQGKSKEEAKLTDLKSDSDSYDNKSSNLKTDMDNIQREMKDKQEMIDKAKVTLDKLKAAKDGIATL